MLITHHASNYVFYLANDSCVVTVTLPISKAVNFLCEI